MVWGFPSKVFRPKSPTKSRLPDINSIIRFQFIGFIPCSSKNYETTSTEMYFKNTSDSQTCNLNVS